MATLSASAQKSFDYNLWPDGAPGDNGITAEETTGEPWKNVTKARMTIYKSDRPSSKCIIMCPGGGYMSEWWVNEGTSFAHWMHNQHITYIVMKYRLPNGGHHEIPLCDVQEAIREVRAHAAEWNVDPHAVGIMGASAGGHLAASAATLFTSPENRPTALATTCSERIHRRSSSSAIALRSRSLPTPRVLLSCLLPTTARCLQSTV